MNEIIEYLKNQGLDFTDKENELDRYFTYLESLRETGATNMFGAVPYLVEAFEMSKNKASKILACWMNFYDYLCERFNWRR